MDGKRIRNGGSASLRGVAILILFLGCALPARALEFEYVDPEEAGLDKSGVMALRELLEETNTRSAAVLYKGKLVADWNWRAEGSHSVYEVWSTSKSIASTCIGLLIDEGKIGSIEEPVGKYVPAWNSEDKKGITIAQLLEQTSGLEEKTGFPFSRNQLAAALGAPIIEEPGTTPRYNNAGCNVLSAIISAAAGQDPDAYARAKIWEPMGLRHTWWRRDRADNVITYAGVQTTALELAAFGQLMLNGGVWEGKRLLSEEWIRTATTRRLDLSPAPGIPPVEYGLLWWINFGENVPFNYSSLGLFGNNMTVIPELELVGVRLVGTDPKAGSLMMRTPEWVERLAGIVPKP